MAYTLLPWVTDAIATELPELGPRKGSWQRGSYAGHSWRMHGEMAAASTDGRLALWLALQGPSVASYAFVVLSRDSVPHLLSCQFTSSVGGQLDRVRETWRQGG
jgi:hypothetical protein